MDDEFKKHLKILLKDSQEFLEKNYKDYNSLANDREEVNIDCPVHKKINVKYIGCRFYVDGELIGEPSPEDYHREFFFISCESTNSFYASWCDHTFGGSIDYWDTHLANPEFDTEDDWSINSQTKQEFIKLFK